MFGIINPLSYLIGTIILIIMPYAACCWAI